MLLLVFIRLAMPTIHPIITIIITVIVFQFILLQQMMPILMKLVTLFSDIPYIKLILGSVFLLIVSEVLQKIVEEQQYSTLGYLIQLSCNILLVSLWLQAFSPFIKIVQQYVEKFTISP
jgi:hypothetical protein